MENVYKEKARKEYLRDLMERKSLDELQILIDSDNKERSSYATAEWEIRTGMLWEYFIYIPDEYKNLTKKKKPLPALDTLFGCGLKSCGLADFRGDYSYITTIWITLFYIPIFPLRSIRILDMTSMDNKGKNMFIKYVDVPMHKKQVIRSFIPLIIILSLILLSTLLIKKDFIVLNLLS